MLLRCFLTGLLGMFFMFSTPAAERVEVFNLGVPGLPGTLFKGERLRKVIGGKPDLAVLMFGTNDAVNSSILSSEAAFESVMTASIGEMCRSGIKVILVNLPPCEEALVFERHPKEKYQQLPPNARIRSLNAILQRIAGKHGIPLVDFYSEAARKGTTGAASLIRNPRNGGGRDGIHLTPEGYRILAELIFKAVAKLNFKQGRIFCIGDSITYGAGVQGGGTVTGDTYPARLRECFQKAVPKIGFWTEELIYGEMWRKYGLYDMLKQNGFLANAENTMDFIFGKISEDEIFRRLSQYHCVVISLERGYHSYDYAATTRHYRNALRRYLDQGGGILLVAQNGEYKQDRRIAIFNLMFQEYGVRMLREGVYDPTSEYIFKNHPFLSTPHGADPSYLHFFHTDNIPESAVSDGVKNLYLPLWGDGGMWGTMALKLSPDWTVAVSGKKTARSYQFVETGSKNYFFKKPGSISSAPPVAAFRKVGKGSLGVISVNLMHLTHNVKARDWPAVFEKNGDREKRIPSDGHRLLLNFLRTLSCEALANPALGSYREPAPLPRDPADAVNYSPAVFRGQKHSNQAGLIGVHTAFSDGKGSVGEYVQAAKKAGLKFIAFTESLEHLTEENYEKLKAECKKYSGDDFYACPGIEFTATGGLRWAFWGEAVKYPGRHLFRPGGGKVVHYWGLYAAECDRRPSALLNYRHLRKIGDPSNLWWYFRVPVKVYRNGTLLEDNLDELLFAAGDLRVVGTVLFNGIHTPDDLAGQIRKTGVNRIFGTMDAVRTFLNTKNSFQHDFGYASSGPVIEEWSAVNATNSLPFYLTKGMQRARVRLKAASPVGLKEVVIYSGNDGIYRRFACGGKTTFETVFEAAHDRFRPLVMRVLDSAGGEAVSPILPLVMPFYHILRCTDNLNLLGYSTLAAHPDRHQVSTMRAFEAEEGTPDLTTIRGVDTSETFTFSPYAVLTMSIRSREGNQLAGTNENDDFHAMPMRYPLNSPGISILHADSVRRVDTSIRHRPDKRIGYAHGPFYPMGKKQPIADISLSSHLLRSRIREDLRFTRPWLAQDDYRGGIFFHEIEFRFHKGVTLEGPLPVSVVQVFPNRPFFNPSRGYFDSLKYQKDGRVSTVPTAAMHQEIDNGGFVSVLSSRSSRRIVLYASCRELPLFFVVEPGGSLNLGIGRAGQTVPSGKTVKIALAVVSLADPDQKAEEKLAGTLEFRSGGIYREAAAVNGECRIQTTGSYQICDQAFKVSGIEDNGAAGYYEENGKQCFIFAPVLNGTMYFQSGGDKPSAIWCGNLFISNRKELRMTPVLSGISPGEKPFLEIHNPTEESVSAVISSPPGAPYFGGTEFQVRVPAGQSLIQKLEVKK